MSEYLRQKWMNLTKGLTPKVKALDENSYSLDIKNYFDLIELDYSEPHRFYHTLEHLTNMFISLDCFVPPQYRTKAVQYAIFYHDLKYDPLRKDNEDRSNSRAIATLNTAGEDEETIILVSAMIKATKEHKIPTFIDNSSALFHNRLPELKYFLDLDLSILASIPKYYDKYKENIRKEYYMYSNKEYKEGRIKVLLNFLNRKEIFFTEEFKIFEKEAKKNMVRELLELRS
jgi:predicted metal-dependent HD superfamily phosphohydrolase